MNDLCADIGYKSILHAGEQLCGDHVDIASDEYSTVVVLSDGLGSGVKASILSTLTSKIISTMMAEELSIEDCVRTIAATLPVDSKHGVAYSTFTIVHLLNNTYADVIQYDNPQLILLRNGQNYDYPMQEMIVGDKKIQRSHIRLEEGDLFIAMSDGCPHASAEEATDINFYVGRAVNPAHQDPNLPINFHIKMRLVDELSAALRTMGKRVKVSYF